MRPGSCCSAVVGSEWPSSSRRPNHTERLFAVDRIMVLYMHDGSGIIRIKSVRQGGLGGAGTGGTPATV